MFKSVLFHQQRALSATLSQYGDWQLPRSYGDPEEEVGAAHHGCVLQDRSNLGQIQLTGVDHTDLLHRITTNDVRFLKAGDYQINIFANEKGRIVDRVSLLKFDKAIRLVTSAGSSETVSKWLERFIFIEDVVVKNLHGGVSALGLFGPKAIDLLRAVFANFQGTATDSSFEQFEWRGTNIFATQSKELSVAGFNLIAPSDILPGMWDSLIAAGEPFRLRPMGQAAYEVLRVEAGWPERGKDFGDDVNPHEAGMISYVNFDKGCYIGQEVIARLDTYDKVQKHLTGIRLEGPNPAASGDSILMGDKEVGVVTSSVYSPYLTQGIALGYVHSRVVKEKPDHEVHSADGKWSGRLTSLPFVASKI